MKSFKRVLAYVWPQWPRLVLIVLSAAMISVLFSGSILSAIPLLKVMMGEEGIHGWVDRNIIASRYGLSISLPDRDDALNVFSVRNNEAAQKAGIRLGDIIVAAGTGAAITDANVTAAKRMFEQLAAAPASGNVTVRLLRPAAKGTTSLQLAMEPGRKPFWADYAQMLLRWVPNDTSEASRERAIMLIVVFILFTTIFRCTFRFLQEYTGDKVVQTSLAHLREDTFGHALDIPVGFFSKEGSSDTVSRLIQDITQIGGGLKTMLTKAIREPLVAASLLLTAMWISPKLTLIFLCGAPLAIIAVSNLGKKIRRATKNALRNWAKVLGKLEETLVALKIVKIYNRQSYEHQRFRDINRKLLKHQIRIAKVDAATDPLMEVLGMFAITGGVIFGAHWVFRQNIDATTFFVLLGLLGAAAEAVRKTSDVWNKLQQSNAAAERVFSVVDQPEELEKAEAAELPPFKHKIEFRDIVFGYPGTDRTVLKGINLLVFAGQTIAIVGPNGSGKTTLVNLIPRFYEPNSGSILIDGNDISRVTFSSLRHQMGMVTQNVITFNDTVAANIAYGKSDATMDEIIEAAKHAYAHEFIAPLPDGYDTVIGEQGSGLSGGQLQRIVIARAILKNPPIMIFDEAMSQIDADSEAKIHRALDEFMNNRTVFVIAHRFSTVIKANKIVVMNDGKIIAEGVHDELVETCPLYQNLYQTQLLKD